MLVVVGLYLILALEVTGRGRGAAVSSLCAVLFAAYVVALIVPFTRDFFSLAAPGPSILGPALAGSVLAVLWLAAVDDRFVPGRMPAGA